MNTKIKEFVNEKINKKKSPVILEVGCHYGEDTMDMLKVFNSPIIYCFDPDPRNATFFKKYFGINNKVRKKDFKNINFYELALSKESSEMDFFMSYTEYPEDRPIPKKYEWVGEKNYRKFKLNDSGGSSLKFGYELAKGIKSIKVNAMSLDDWAKDNGVNGIDFMWVDVQGGERDVVEGGIETLKNVKYIWVEHGETKYEGGMSKRETQRLFSSIGFSQIKNDRYNILFENIEAVNELHSKS